MSDEGFVRSQLARRDFLKLGSVALAGTAWPALAFAGVRRLPKAMLTAGYAASEPEENKIVWLTAAERILAGDSSFISRDARVTIRSSRALSQAGDTRGASIDVVFPALGFEPDAYPTYRAWSARRDEFMQHASAPVSFRVPVEATTGLQLVFSRLNPDESAAPEGSGLMRLSLGSSSSDPKLQRGIYIVAYGEPAVSNWGAVPITRQGREIIVPRAEFSYVVLSVDYAD
jgi:hypothetical protein